MNAFGHGPVAPKLHIYSKELHIKWDITELPGWLVVMRDRGAEMYLSILLLTLQGISHQNFGVSYGRSRRNNYF